LKQIWGQLDDFLPHNFGEICRDSLDPFLVQFASLVIELCNQILNIEINTSEITLIRLQDSDRNEWLPKKESLLMS
jgi:hypothetical protein